MKNKLATLLLASCMIITLMPFKALALEEEKDFMWRIADNAEDKATYLEESSPSCHDAFKTLVEALMKVKQRGLYSKEDIKAIHKFYEGQVASKAKMPTDSKGLLELLYSSKVITKVQYDQTLDLLN